MEVGKFSKRLLAVYLAGNRAITSEIDWPASIAESRTPSWTIIGSRVGNGVSVAPPGMLMSVAVKKPPFASYPTTRW